MLVHWVVTCWHAGWFEARRAQYVSVNGFVGLKSARMAHACAFDAALKSPPSSFADSWFAPSWLPNRYVSVSGRTSSFWRMRSSRRPSFIVFVRMRISSCPAAAMPAVPCVPPRPRALPPRTAAGACPRVAGMLARALLEMAAGGRMGLKLSGTLNDGENKVPPIASNMGAGPGTAIGTAIGIAIDASAGSAGSASDASVDTACGAENGTAIGKGVWRIGIAIAIDASADSASDASVDAACGAENDTAIGKGVWRIGIAIDASADSASDASVDAACCAENGTAIGEFGAKFGLWTVRARPSVERVGRESAHKPSAGKGGAAFPSSGGTVKPCCLASSSSRAFFFALPAVEPAEGLFSEGNFWKNLRIHASLIRW